MSYEENTPFLADNEHEQHLDSLTLRKLPADAHFRRPLGLLTTLNALSSFLIFGLAVATYVIIKKTDFTYSWQSEEVTRGLWIVMLINFILATSAVFLKLPILLNISREIAMSIVILVFSIPVIQESGPRCQRWQYDPPSDDIGVPRRPHMIPGTESCKKTKLAVNIMMPVAAIVGIVIGVINLSSLMLRLVALYRTKFWERFFKTSGTSGWNGAGFTVQFSLSVVPNTANHVPASASSEGEGRLVDAN